MSYIPGQLELPRELVRQFFGITGETRVGDYPKPNAVELREYRPDGSRAPLPRDYKVFGFPVAEFVRRSAEPWKRPADRKQLYTPKPGDGCTYEEITQ